MEADNQNIVDDIAVECNLYLSVCLLVLFVSELFDRTHYIVIVDYCHHDV